MEKNRLRQLLSDYSAGTIGGSDLDMLLDYVASHHGDADLDSLLAETLDGAEPDDRLAVDSEGLYNRIIEHPRFSERPSKAKRRQWMWYGAAAVAFLAGGFLLLQMKYINDVEIVETTPAMVSRTVTTAPSDRPILRLANGKVIDLDSAANGMLAVEDGTQIIFDGTALHYEGDVGGANGEILRNTIVTPKGRQYQLVLPDGSRIWLNAATTLTYPVNFNKDKRQVEVRGEAYFEVEKAANWPFVVNTEFQQIEVLGTHFNISAYDDDEHAKTTLVEGRVKVVSSADGQRAGQTKVLIPGQQAITLRGSSHIKVDKIDTEEVMSWKENLFVFNNEEISEVMKKVSRWYDVEVEYLDGMAGKRIGGSIPRLSHVEELMEALKATGLLHYKMKGGTVVVME